MRLLEQEADTGLEALAREAELVDQGGLSSAQVAALGVIEVTNAHMERAIRVISVERGYDPQDFTLVSFGGAGGLHASNLARAVGIPTVFVPSGASTLSAFGMITADLLKDYVQTIMLPGDTPYEELRRRIEPLTERGLLELREQGILDKEVTLHRELDLRYVGQGYELSVPLNQDYEQAFHDLHKMRYGHSSPGVPVEVVNLRVRAVGTVAKPVLPKTKTTEVGVEQALMGDRPVVLDSTVVQDIPFYMGEKLQPGHRLVGPAIVVYQDTTVYLAENDLAEVDEGFNLVVDVG
jgi:N-methylhydantoinase A